MLLAGVIASLPAGSATASIGTLNVHLAGVSLVSSGNLKITGSLAATLAPTTVVAIAIPPNTAALSGTLDGVTLAAGGQQVPPISSALDITLSSITVAALGGNLPHIAGTLAAALGAITISAAGSPLGIELREDGSRELREDGGVELRE